MTLRMYPGYGGANKGGGWRRYSPEEIRLRSAFNEVYGPQLKSTLHNQAMMEPGPAGEAKRKQFGHIGQYPGGYFTSGGHVGTPSHGYKTSIPYQTPTSGGDINEILDRMWRMQTDPYLNAVGGGMSAQGVMRAMTPGGSVGGSNPAAWARMVKQRGG